MNNWEEEIKHKLDNLEKVPERNPLRAQSSRKNFILEAQKLAGSERNPHPKRSWWNQVQIKKETFPMKLITLFVILTLLFGGGISAVAAQGSLPGDILYPVKNLVEDIELGLATKPDTQFEIALKHANQRFEEIHTIIESGELPPEPLYFKWQMQLQTALQYALQTNDPTGKLLIVQQMLQNQTMTMNMGQQTGEPFQNNFAHMLSYQAGLIDAGLEQPELLASELEYMAKFEKQYGRDELEEEWQNLYQEQFQLKNTGEIKQPVEYPWMFLRGERNSEVEPGFTDQGGESGGSQNSNNNQSNGGNQGDNENGNNGGNGENGGGSGGK